MFKNSILNFVVILKNSNQNNFQPMKTNPQKQYDSPRIRVLEVKIEGFLCDSKEDYGEEYEVE